MKYRPAAYPAVESHTFNLSDFDPDGESSGSTPFAYRFCGVDTCRTSRSSL
jgi:hypothetical protein